MVAPKWRFPGNFAVYDKDTAITDMEIDFTQRTGGWTHSIWAFSGSSDRIRERVFRPGIGGRGVLARAERPDLAFGRGNGTDINNRISGPRVLGNPSLGVTGSDSSFSNLKEHSSVSRLFYFSRAFRTPSFPTKNA